MEFTDTDRFTAPVIDTRKRVAEMWLSATNLVKERVNYPETDMLADFLNSEAVVMAPVDGGLQSLTPRKKKAFGLVPILGCDLEHMPTAGSRQSVGDEFGAATYFNPAERAIYLSSRPLTTIGRGIMLLTAAYDAKAAVEGVVKTTDDYWQYHTQGAKLQLDMLYEVGGGNFTSAVAEYTPIINSLYPNITARSPKDPEDRRVASYLKQIFEAPENQEYMPPSELNEWSNIAYDAAVVETISRIEDPTMLDSKFMHYLRTTTVA